MPGIIKFSALYPIGPDSQVVKLLSSCTSDVALVLMTGSGFLASYAVLEYQGSRTALKYSHPSENGLRSALGVIPLLADSIDCPKLSTAHEYATTNNT